MPTLRRSKSRFQGVLFGERGTKLVRGTRTTGLCTIAASTKGAAIQVELRHREGADEYRILLTGWPDKTVIRELVPWSGL